MGANCSKCGELWTSAGPDGDYCDSCGLTQAHGADVGSADDGEQSQDHKPTTQANALIAVGEKAQPFHDPLGETYARFEVDDHLETWPLDSRHWRSWLARSY